MGGVPGSAVRENATGFKFPRSLQRPAPSACEKGPAMSGRLHRWLLWVPCLVCWAICEVFLSMPKATKAGGIILFGSLFTAAWMLGVSGDVSAWWSSLVILTGLALGGVLIAAWCHVTGLVAGPEDEDRGLNSFLVLVAVSIDVWLWVSAVRIAAWVVSPDANEIPAYGIAIWCWFTATGFVKHKRGKRAEIGLPTIAAADPLSHVT